MTMTNNYLEKLPGENATFSIDCSGALYGDQTIVGAPTLSAVPGDEIAGGLTFGTPIVNTEPVSISGRTVQAGKAIQVRIGGGTVPSAMRSRPYSVIATLATSTGDTVQVKVTMVVLTTKPDLII